MRFLENSCTIMVRLQRVFCRALQSGQRTTAIARPTMVSPMHPHARVGLQRLDLATDGAVGDVELQRGVGKALVSRRRRKGVDGVQRGQAGWPCGRFSNARVAAKSSAGIRWFGKPLVSGGTLRLWASLFATSRR